MSKINGIYLKEFILCYNLMECILRCLKLLECILCLKLMQCVYNDDSVSLSHCIHVYSCRFSFSK